MLTALYVPGNRPDRFGKAAASGADLVVLDLEDAVPPADKDRARAHAVDWAAGHDAVEIRVNRLDSPWGAEDVKALAALPAVRVRLPKVEHPDDVRRLLDLLPTATVSCLLESPVGVERAFAIAGADPRVAGIALGEADLSSALGVDGDDGLAWVRARLVNASRAAGLGAPMMSAYARVSDLDGLRASCVAGRRLGFSGRMAVHPRQLPIIVSAFTPTDDEVTAANRLLDAVDRAGVADGGVIMLADGRMVDPAMVGRAREIVHVAAEARTQRAVTGG